MILRCTSFARPALLGIGSGIAIGIGPLAVVPARAADPPAPAPAYDYILWDGHRFGRTPEEQERDFRWYRDLGFTHSYLGNAGDDLPTGADEHWRNAFRLAAKYDLFVGLRYGFHRETADLAARMKLTPEQMIERGILLSKEAPKEHPAYNPMHPEVIAYYTAAFTRSLEAYRRFDEGGRLRLFLLGTEMGWPLPKKPDAAHPAAVAQIMALARADGVLKADAPDDYAALDGWWGDSYSHGGCWRLWDSIETAFRARVPEAQFMNDPIWAVKIAHGFGGTWTYIQDDPKNIAVAVKRLQAVTRPAPAAHSTQLIRGAVHDAVLDANLLAIAMGVNKLYHWGLNTVEPGREAAPAYGKKDWKASPPGFPLLAVNQVTDWKAFLLKLHAQRQSVVGAKLWAALPTAVAKQVEDFGVLGGEEGLPADAPVKAAVVAALNAALPRAVLAPPPAGMKPGPRLAELIARHTTTPLTGDDIAEHNRLLLEVLFADALDATPSPNLCELREDVRQRRASIEPAVRSTGRLLRDRGELFAQWRPLGPRLALLSGIFTHAELNLALIAGQVPFDILRSARDRRELLAGYQHIALVKGAMGAAEYEALRQAEARGATIYVPKDFQPPAGLPALARAVSWEPDAVGKPPAAARELRALFHQAGLRPYFDTESADVVLGGYSFKGKPVLLAVNDQRTYPPGREAKGLASVGQPNEITVLVRDRRAGLRVLDVDTGRELPLTATADGATFRDTLGAAWYGLYAVLAPGETWDGPGPLPPAPTIATLTAAREPGGAGVRLAWTLPFTDWVGCDLARYRVFRAEGDAAPAPLAEIEGRILTGSGGVVTTWIDTTAAAGKPYRYQLRSVSPLRREGPLSAMAAVAGP